MKDIFAGIGMLIILFCVLLACWISMVGEPRCEEKGFAGIDIKGCWIIKDHIRVYEK